MGTSFLAVVSYVILITASALHLVAFSTDYWLCYTTDVSVVMFDYHLGMWNTCVRKADASVAGAVNETVTVMTEVTGSWSCTNTHSWLDNVNNGI